jgi:hypothetical protein
LFAGIFYDRYGPRQTIILGCVFAFIGWGLLWMFTDGRIEASQASVAAAYFIGANAQTWFDTGALVTNIGNFQSQRSIIIGLEKSYTGLGASILSEAYTALFRIENSQDGVTPFLLALCLSVTIVPFIAAFFLNKIPETSDAALEPVRKRILYGYFWTYMLAAALLSAALLQYFLTPTPLLRYSLLAVVGVIILVLFSIPYVGKSRSLISSSSSNGRGLPRGVGINNELTPLIQVPPPCSPFNQSIHQFN